MGRNRFELYKNDDLRKGDTKIFKMTVRKLKLFLRRFIFSRQKVCFSSVTKTHVSWSICFITNKEMWNAEIVLLLMKSAPYLTSGKHVASAVGGVFSRLVSSFFEEIYRKHLEWCRFVTSLWIQEILFYHDLKSRLWELEK